MQHWPVLVLSALLFCFGTTNNALAADPPPIEVSTNNAAKQKTEALARKLEDSAAVQTFQQYLGQDVLGIGILSWQLVAAFIAILAGLIIKRIALSFLQKRIENFVQKTEAEWAFGLTMESYEKRLADIEEDGMERAWSRYKRPILPICRKSKKNTKEFKPTTDVEWNSKERIITSDNGLLNVPSQLCQLLSVEQFVASS